MDTDTDTDKTAKSSSTISPPVFYTSAILIAILV